MTPLILDGGYWFLGRCFSREAQAGAANSVWPNEFEVEAFSDGLGGALECVECHGGVAGVEEAIEGGAAGFHAAGHSGFGKAFGLHRLANLEGEDFFEGLDFAFRKEIFFGEEIVE